MKLKKIASLALAGVMAVSMLAGCGSNGGENPGEQPATNNVSLSTDVVGTVNADNAVKNAGVTITAGSDITEKVEAFVEKYGQDALTGFGYTFQYVIDEDNAAVSPLNDRFTAYMGNTNTSNFTELSEKLEKQKVGTTVSATKLYVVNASVSNDAIAEMVAGVLAPRMAKYTVDDTLSSDKVKTQFGVKYSYTVSVSVVEDSIDYDYISTNNGTVKYVAVMVTGTSAKDF